MNLLLFILAIGLFSISLLSFSLNWPKLNDLFDWLNIYLVWLCLILHNLHGIYILSVKLGMDKIFGEDMEKELEMPRHL